MEAGERERASQKTQEKQLLPSNKVARMRVLASTAALNIFSSIRGRFHKVQTDLTQMRL